MNREILFKAKRIDNGEWVEGSALFDEKGNCYIGTYLFPHNVEVTFGGRSNGKTLKRFNAIGFIQIDANTLCQFTGLTDKNGNKIWENDIIVYDNSSYNVYCEPHKGQIAFRHGCMCFKYLLYGSITYKSFLSDDFFEKKCDVIGNIFDNADLLGKE